MKTKIGVLSITMFLLFSCSPAKPTQENKNTVIATEIPVTEQMKTLEIDQKETPTETIPTLTPELISNFSKAYLVASLGTLNGTETSCDITSPLWRVDVISIGIYGVTDSLPNTIDIMLQVTGNNGLAITYTSTAILVADHYELTLSLIEPETKLSNFSLVDLASKATYILVFTKTGEQIGSICNIQKEISVPSTSAKGGGRNSNADSCHPGIIAFLEYGDPYPGSSPKVVCQDGYAYDDCGTILINWTDCIGPEG